MRPKMLNGLVWTFDAVSELKILAPKAGGGMLTASRKPC
jgi:hypothetical protein